MRAALILCLCSAYRLCSSQLAPIWTPCSSAGIPHGCRALAWLAHPRLRVAVRDWRRHGLRRQQCVNAAPLARSGLVASSSVYFLLAPCWPHPPMVWGSIGSECVKRLPPSRPWSPQRHLRRPCCSRGGSGKAPDCFGTDGRPRQPAGHLLVWNIPRKSLESYGTDF